LNFADKTVNLIKGYFHIMALYIIYGLAITFLQKYFNAMDTSMYDQESIAELISSNPIKAGFMILILAPVLEEIMFRTLIRPSHLELMLFFMIWPIFFIGTIVPIDAHWAITAVFIGVLLFSLAYLLSQLIPEKRTLGLRNFLDRQYLFFWFASSIVFGFVHITNYVDNYMVNLALFVLIAPRIIAGFMMGWIKLKNGSLAWSMALHFMNNALPFLLAMGLPDK
tara:strand:+ start:1394 stop:2065 length:672 start_codon:yes stop_codon:yes gene_type:complete